MFTSVLIGLVVLVLGVCLGAYLGTLARRSEPETVDNGQSDRNRRVARALRYNGGLVKPRLSESDRKHFGL